MRIYGRREMHARWARGVEGGFAIVGYRPAAA